MYQSSNAEDRDIEGKKLSAHRLIGGDLEDLFDPDGTFAMDVKDGGIVKQSSMYQGSGEMRRIQEVRDGGKNLEPYLNDGTFLSFELINQFPQPKKEPLVPFLLLETESPSVDNIQSLPKSNMEFLDLSFRDLPEERSKISISYSGVVPAGGSSADSVLGICLRTEDANGFLRKEAAEFVEQVEGDGTKWCRNQLLCTGADANIIDEKDFDSICSLSRTFSKKVGICNCHHEEREIMKSSHKTRFSPLKKMLDPVMKSKSLRSLSLVEPGTTSSTPDTARVSEYKVFPKSLLNDFSKADQKIDGDRARDQVIKTAASPVHLHAVLKREFSHGGSSYEFFVKDSKDVLSARTWKTENAFNWVYTFHCCKTKSNIISHGRKNRHLQPSLMIGQMQVSCFLCSEVSEAGALDNSVVTEFTLYDIAQVRRGVEVERSHFSSDSNQTSAFSNADNSVRRYSSEFDSEPSTSYPWASAELQPNLEIAAIVTRIPFTKKEALENMQVRESESRGSRDLSSSRTVDRTRVTIDGHSSPAYVKVVTPSGKHGLHKREELGPSSLLERWRLGGGCDCGGWDMGCPITVFENGNNDNVISREGDQQATALFGKV